MKVSPTQPAGASRTAAAALPTTQHLAATEVTPAALSDGGCVLVCNADTLVFVQVEAHLLESAGSGDGGEPPSHTPHRPAVKWAAVLLATARTDTRVMSSPVGVPGPATPCACTRSGAAGSRAEHAGVTCYCIYTAYILQPCAAVYMLHITCMPCQICAMTTSSVHL